MSVSLKMGQLVFSSSLGLGKIVGTEKVGNDRREFYIIQLMNGHIKSFLPMDQSDQLRVLTSEETIKKVINILGQTVPDNEMVSFEQRQERINYFKEQSQSNDIWQSSKILNELLTLEDRGKIENKILDKLIENLALETSMVLGIDLGKSREIILKAVKGEKYEF